MLFRSKDFTYAAISHPIDVGSKWGPINHLAAQGILVLLSIYWYRLGIFTSQEKMKAYLANKQIIGPLIFTLIQIIQVVIPIIPGGVSLLGGVIFFGPIWGFIYNYVGICLGSIILFFLARHYGRPFILHLVSEKTYEKYMKWTANQKKFNWFFALCIIAPMAPDDILCMIDTSRPAVCTNCTMS